MKNVIKSTAKYIRMSPRKVRLVIDLIRDMNAAEALETLNFVNKAAAKPVYKTLKSAVSDAENNFDKDVEKLFVVEARVDEAPTLKRGRAVSRGRYHQILKRASHIVIGVAEK